MILYKSLILLVILDSFVKTENTKHCFYSRYMFFAFKLHAINLDTKFVNYKEDSLNLEELKKCGEALRAQGQTVLAILDDLMTENNQSLRRPKDMMAINLYLNNVSNTLLVRTYDGPEREIISDLPTNKHSRHLLFQAENEFAQVDLLKESEPDNLELLRNVALLTKLEDDTYPDITILFSMAQRTFDVDCLKSFQQQVLAATAHPVLSVIGSYVSLVKLMFYTGDEKFKDVTTRVELFKKNITNLGFSILNTFVGFIRLGLYPEKVLDHLKLTALELEKLVKYNDKENIQVFAPEWIGQIFKRYFNPMLLNNLRVLNEDESISISSEKDCNNAINALIMKADKVGKYVNDLRKYKNFYHETVIDNPFFSHEDMFLIPPECDIIKQNRFGYNRLVGSRPNVKDQELHLLDL